MPDKIGEMFAGSQPTPPQLHGFTDQLHPSLFSVESNKSGLNNNPTPNSQGYDRNNFILQSIMFNKLIVFKLKDRKELSNSTN